MQSRKTLGARRRAGVNWKLCKRQAVSFLRETLKRVCVCVCCVCIHTRVPQHVCGVQRTALWASCLLKPLCGLDLGPETCVTSVFLLSHLSILQEDVLSITKGQQEDSGIMILATKPDNLCLIPRVHMVEGED